MGFIFVFVYLLQHLLCMKQVSEKVKCFRHSSYNKYAYYLKCKSLKSVTFIWNQVLLICS